MLNSDVKLTNKISFDSKRRTFEETIIPLSYDIIHPKINQDIEFSRQARNDFLSKQYSSNNNLKIANLISSINNNKQKYFNNHKKDLNPSSPFENLNENNPVPVGNSSTSNQFNDVSNASLLLNKKSNYSNSLLPKTLKLDKTYIQNDFLNKIENISKSKKENHNHNLNQNQNQNNFFSLVGHELIHPNNSLNNDYTTDSSIFSKPFSRFKSFDSLKSDSNLKAKLYTCTKCDRDYPKGRLSQHEIECCWIPKQFFNGSSENKNQSRLCLNIDDYNDFENHYKSKMYVYKVRNNKIGNYCGKRFTPNSRYREFEKMKQRKNDCKFCSRLDPIKET